MRCLAVQQPFAWAICAGFKRVENRTFSTPYRGRVAIVASSKKAEGNRVVREFPGGRLPADLFIYGAYIGAAMLTDVVPLSEAVENDPHASGPVCWLLTQPKLFRTPIPTKGKLNLYHPTDEELAALELADAEPGVAIDDPAIARLGAWLPVDPFDLVCSQAEEYLFQQAASDLLRTAGRLLGMAPERADGYFYRAMASALLGGYAQALPDCNRAIEIDPADGRYYLGRADVHDGMGDSAAATADETKAFELDPSLAGQPDEEERD